MISIKNNYTNIIDASNDSPKDRRNRKSRKVASKRDSMIVNQ